MLPRKKTLRVLCLLMAAGVGVNTLVTAPAQAIIRYTPPVTIQEITPKFVTTSTSGLSKTVQVVAPTDTKLFSVVGLTWLGAVSADTVFKARVRESGKWSSWNELHFSDDHGVDLQSSEADGTRSGTDPFMTAEANAIEVVMTNKTGLAPKDLRVDLIGSQETKQDRALLSGVRDLNSAETLNYAAVTPSGGVVLRPKIVTRAEWGANETWRDPVPRMGTKIVAGFVHHTASTNNYSPEQAPAQMRALYAYYTKSLKYADMAYNFLVDQYGNVYEGRNACTFGDAKPCDGPSLPVIGAHTAGLNPNTFAISAIGNYDTKAPSNPEALVEAIASLMAWKLAPYGLDPNANASMISSDTSGLSKYSKGMTAVTPVISGHRDVGKTACPGRYLYPYMDEIRARATTKLLPVIRDLSVKPSNLDQISTENVKVKVTVPATAQWSIEVVNEATGLQVKSVSGVQATTGPIDYVWNKTDQNGIPVPSGRYFVLAKASLPSFELPRVRRFVTIASPPKILSKVTFTRISPTKTKVMWEARTATIAPVTSNEFRVSLDGKKTWSKWTRAQNPTLVTSRWKLGKTYYVELRGRNQIGESKVVQKKYVVLPYSPPKPEAVTGFTFTQSKPNAVTASWSAKGGDYESLGFFTRVSINGGKWSAWTKTKNLDSFQVINTKPGDKVRILVVEKNLTGSSPTAVGRYTAK